MCRLNPVSSRKTSLLSKISFISLSYTLISSINLTLFLSIGTSYSLFLVIPIFFKIEEINGWLRLTPPASNSAVMPLWDRELSENTIAEICDFISVLHDAFFVIISSFDKACIIFVLIRNVQLVLCNLFICMAICHLGSNNPNHFKRYDCLLFSSNWISYL